jgi:peptide deformylase
MQTETNQKVISLGQRFVTGACQCPELVYAGDPVLRRVATLVAAQDTAVDIFRRLQSALLRYREATGAGRGIAAPQIGISARVFATFLDGEWRYFLNPRIIAAGEEKKLMRERCLSCGPISVDVARPYEITLQWDDEGYGTRLRETFTDRMARIVQHEVDHLDGILCVDPDRAEPGSYRLSVEDAAAETFRPYP